MWKLCCAVKIIKYENYFAMFFAKMPTIIKIITYKKNIIYHNVKCTNQELKN